MKNPWEWEENDLLELVKAGTQESVELDFKRSDALQNVKRQKDVRYEISKDISALANSAGGTLIYGMLEDGYVATGLDGGSDPNVVKKEWLQQVINSTIHRKIDGVRVNQIALTTHNPGKVAYVVYIPQSMRTPHQALDKKFYKRYEFESLPMEEYEVRDLYNRGGTPDLRIEFPLPKTELVFNEGATLSEPFPLFAVIINDALEPANYAVIKLFIDAKLTIENAQGLVMNSGSLFRGGKLYSITFLQYNWSIPAKFPIFNSAVFEIPDNPILLRTSTDGQHGKPMVYLLGYEIKSPRMPIKSAYTLLHVRSGYATVSRNNLSFQGLAANFENLKF
jgi:Putative DNA-binding domain